MTKGGRPKGGWMKAGLGVLCVGALLGFTLGTAHAGWWGEAAFLYLTEVVPGKDLFWIDRNSNFNLDPGESRINTDRLLGWDFDGGNWGWRAEIGYQWPTQWGVSLGYLGRVSYRSDSISSPTEDIQPRFGPNPNNTFGFGGLEDFESSSLVDMKLDTMLHSWEANLRVPVWQPNNRFRLTGRVGPRFTWMTDDLTYRAFDDFPPSSDPNDRADLKVKMDNLFYGAQVGLGFEWQICPWFSVVWDGAVGGYYADIDQKVTYREFDGTQDRWSLSDSKGTWGAMAEARLMGEIRILQNLSARLGYMVLWFSDTGRAINQIRPGQGLDEDIVDILPASYPKVKDDYTLYHGGMFSLVFRF